MLAAVHDVHHRHGQGAGGDAAQVAVEGQAHALRGRFGDGQGDAQNSVGPQALFLFRAVEFDESLVYADLIGSVPTHDGFGDFFVNGRYRFQHTLAAIAALIAIPLLPRFVHPGRSARRHNRRANRTIKQHNVHFHRRVATRI